jgi:hypothetical protein
VLVRRLRWKLREREGVKETSLLPMPKSLTDNPLSILLDAFVSLLMIGMTIFDSNRFHLMGFWEMAGVVVLAIPAGALLWPVCVVGGVLQLWGLLSYTLLGFAFVYHVWGERSSRSALLAAYAIQSVETPRFLLQHNNWEPMGSPGVIAYTIANAAIGAALLAVDLRHRRRKPLLE